MKTATVGALMAGVVGTVGLALSTGAWSLPGSVLTPSVSPVAGTVAAQANSTLGAPTHADFVGAATCAECHQEQYAVWSGSTHGRAGGPATPERVIAPFDGTPIRFADAEVIPRASANGVYSFTVRRAGRLDVTYTVDGVIGGGHMVGGGTQGFVSQHEDGTVRFLPFDWSRSENAWFCNTGRVAGWWTPGAERARLRRDEGWVLIDEQLRLAECGDWPPARVLGTDLRFANCQGCHGSQITLAHDPGAGAYETRIGSLDINCESCHGPGLAHVELARSGAMSEAADARILQPATLDEDGSVNVCLQCHALKRALQTGYLPGADFETYYSTLLPEVGARPYYPDGRIRTFGYQLTHRQSACYLNGAMTCVDCHDPHGQGYRDVAAAPLPDRFDDGQCLGCHVSKAADVTAHTGHVAESEGSRCVSCHMPYVQQPELGDQVRYARSDHTIPLPRPGFDESLGLTSACAACHADRPTRELVAWAEVRWGRTKPHDAVESALFAAEAAGPAATTTAHALALLQPGHPNAMALVAGMNHLVEGYLVPDMEELDGAVEASLRSLTEHPDVDVRAVALATLHLARGGEPETRDFLTSRLESLGADQEAVLRRWVAALRFLADRHRQSGDPVTALEVVRKGLEIAPGAAPVLLDMGGLFDAAGDPTEAGEYYRRSLDADPTQSVAWVNLGRSLEVLGDTDQAAAAYEQALALYSGEALAHVNLGNLILAGGNYADAMDRYRLGVAADPGLSLAWFNLALAYLGLELRGQAAEALRTALEFDPDDAEARSLLTRIESELP